MKRKILLSASHCLIVFLVSNACCAQNGHSGMATVWRAIDSANALYFRLFAKSDTAIVNLYSEDATLMPPNAPEIKGRKALVRDFSEAFASGKLGGVRFVTTGIYGNSKAYVTEKGNWQVIDRSGKVFDDGKYLKLWILTHGQWKIFRDSFNSNHKTQ